MIYYSRSAIKRRFLPIRHFDCSEAEWRNLTLLLM